MQTERMAGKAGMNPTVPQPRYEQFELQKGQLTCSATKLCIWLNLEARSLPFNAKCGAIFPVARWGLCR